MPVPFLSFDEAKMTCDKFFMNSMVGPFQVCQMQSYNHKKTEIGKFPNAVIQSQNKTLIAIFQNDEDWLDFFEIGNRNPAVAR